VAASRLPTTQTRIPDTPDQTEFLSKWFEFHQGYRITQSQDGGEQRIAVIGEPLRDVDPGHLPRTLDELRAGRLATVPFQNETRETVTSASTVDTPQQSLDDALEELLQDAIAEDMPASSVPVPAAVAPSVPSTNMMQPRGHAATLPSVETFLEAQSQSQAPQPSLQSTLDAEYAQAEAALVAAQQLRISRRAQAETAEAEEEVAREHLRRVRRRQITAGNFARVFGTREDVQSDEYVSPITSMFTRVSQWGRRTESQRRALENYEDIHQQTQAAQANAPAPDLLSTGELLSNWRADRRNSLGSLNRNPDTSPVDTGLSMGQRLEALRARQEARAEFLRNIAGPSRAEQDVVGVRPYVPNVPASRDWRTPSDLEQSNSRATTFSNVSRRLSSIAAEFQADLSRTETNGLPSTADLRRRLTEIEDSIGELRNSNHAELLPEAHASLEASERQVRILHEQAQNVQLQAERVQEIMEARRATARHSRALELLREARSNLERSAEGENSNNEMTLENQARALLTLSEADHSLARRWRTAAPSMPERPSPIKGLDGDERPEAKTEEAMVFKLECRICYSQIADTACLPCGHLAMCQWCADQTIPVKDEDRTRPKDKFVKCPMCRVRVKQRVKIFAC
jgi:hypothetical protein